MNIFDFFVSAIAIFIFTVISSVDAIGALLLIAWRPSRFYGIGILLLSLAFGILLATLVFMLNIFGEDVSHSLSQAISVLPIGFGLSILCVFPVGIVAFLAISLSRRKRNVKE